MKVPSHPFRCIPQEYEAQSQAGASSENLWLNSNGCPAEVSFLYSHRSLVPQKLFSITALMLLYNNEPNSFCTSKVVKGKCGKKTANAEACFGGCSHPRLRSLCCYFCFLWTEITCCREMHFLYGLHSILWNHFIALISLASSLKLVTFSSLNEDFCLI